ncbi:MAG: hypothetical protein KDC44_21080, partial [Phaeodactylibacter sp.]|nr:hypothetical protein [Phaeodactylibacter sp.]
FNNDEVLDGDDLLNFIIHDNAGGQLGATFGTSIDGSFNFPGAVTLGQSYYISPVAGSDDGSGKIDFTDACLSVGQGIEVIFYEPSISATVPAEVCTGECYDWAITLVGFPGFTLDYDIVTPAGTFSESAVSNQNTLTITICPGILGVNSGTVELVPLNLDDLNCSNSLNSAPSYSTLVNEIPETDLVSTLCAGESLLINGVTYDAGNPSGTETLIGAAANGCDSIVNIDLDFFPAALLNIDQTLCEGGSLVVNGTTYDESNPSGQEVLPGGSVSGCDSTININLSFNTAIFVDLDPILCEGESVVVNGVTYDAGNPTGTETFIGGSVLGCDSIVNIDLSFFSPNIVDLSTTLCNGESLLINGTTYDAANPTGTEVIAGGDQNGCDSMINITLAFFPESIEILDQTLCEGSSITVNGTV